MNLGKSIKLIRIASDIQQQELAPKLGVTKNYLSLLESNKRKPSLTILESLAKELAISTGAFFDPTVLAEALKSILEKH